MRLGNNYTKRAFWLSAVIIVLLLCMFFIPRLDFFGIRSRRVDILSDVLAKDSLGNPIAEMFLDSLQGFGSSDSELSADIDVMRPDYKDSIPEGLVVVEDFADSTGQHREMDKFYKALDSSGERQVRIAFFGDSYIEGDILTSALRDMYQSKYGGRGVGWVEVSCISETFRTTVHNENSGWSKHYTTDKSDYSASSAGLAGSYFIPSPVGKLTLRCQNSTYGEHLSYVDEVNIYADMSPSLHLSTRVNDSINNSFTGGGISGIERFSQGGKISKVELTASGSGKVYGVSMDGRTGICLDNYSMRGRSGNYLADLSSGMLERMREIRGYDLIIFEYGLNIAHKGVHKYDTFVKNFTPIISRMQKYFPNSSILVLGCSDRGERSPGGGFRTMSGIKELISYQRKMCHDRGIAFWDMREAIGGDGAMNYMSKEKMSAKDMTHINYKGGSYIAGKLFSALENGKMNYDRRRLR